MRRRVLIATLAVTIATLVLFGAPLAWALGRIYRGDQLSKLQQAATVAAAAVPVGGFHTNDPIDPPAAPTGVDLAYYDDRGALVTGIGPLRADRLAAQVLSGGHPGQGPSGSRLVAAQPITANETTIGTVEASSSLPALEWRIQRAWLAMVVLGVVVMAAAALIALWQARRLVRPVDDLIAIAQRLGDGDFTVAAPHSGITEVDRAGQALVSTAGRLRRVVERERAFTANASHQLRTPLTALRLSLDNALITPGVDVEDAVRQAVTEVDRLQDTLEQLFLLARSGGAIADAGVRDHGGSAGGGSADGAAFGGESAGRGSNGDAGFDGAAFGGASAGGGSNGGAAFRGGGAGGGSAGGGGAGGAGNGSVSNGGAGQGDAAEALVRRSVPVGDVLGDLERRWHPMLAARGRRFEVRNEDTVAQRRAPATLGQILDILVDNAATHGRGTVEVAARAVSGGISIGVYDEGDGLAGVGSSRASSSAVHSDTVHSDTVHSDAGHSDTVHSDAQNSDAGLSADGHRLADDGHGLGLVLARSLAEAAGGRLVLRSWPSDREPVAAVILP